MRHASSRRSPDSQAESRKHQRVRRHRFIWRLESVGCVRSRIRAPDEKTWNCEDTRLLPWQQTGCPKRFGLVLGRKCTQRFKVPQWFSRRYTSDKMCVYVCVCVLKMRILQTLITNLGTEHHLRPKKLQVLANLSKHPVWFTVLGWTYSTGKTLPRAMFQAEGSGWVSCWHCCPQNLKSPLIYPQMRCDLKPKIISLFLYVIPISYRIHRTDPQNLSIVGWHPWVVILFIPGSQSDRLILLVSIACSGNGHVQRCLQRLMQYMGIGND